jgi:hypothetical protein
LNALQAPVWATTCVGLPLVTGGAAFLCCAVAGEILDAGDAWAEAGELGKGDGDVFGVGFGFGVAVGFIVGRPRSFAFRTRDEASMFGPADEFGFLAGCRVRFNPAGAGPALLRAMLRLAGGEEDFAPGIVKTTSSLFPCGSTRAVAPGCKRNETIVLSPPRCTFTSEKARPRTASARGTSAGGILT